MPSAPISRAALDFMMAVSVQLEPVPAMTGMRPFTVSSTRRMTASSSSCVMVLDSPVVPRATMPSVPFCTCHSHSSASFSKFTLPSGWKGVINAT